MIRSPIGMSIPTLDARWIIALWVAIHGVASNGARTVSDAGGEVMLGPDGVHAAAGSAILALAALLDTETAQAIAAALRHRPATAITPSDSQVEDALKRLGIRLYDRSAADKPAVNGMSVAGFGKICWPVPSV